MVWFKGEVILIMGGVFGLGCVVVDWFVEEGVWVVILDKFEFGLKEIECKYVDNIEIIVGDVCFIDDNENVVDFCVLRFGKIDIVIGNVGIWDYLMLLDDLFKD